MMGSGPLVCTSTPEPTISTVASAPVERYAPVKALARMIGSGCGKNDVRARGFDGDGPFVAGDVPIELVVIVEELQGVGDGVVD